MRSIMLRADALQPTDRATRQLTLDASDDKPLAIEAVADDAALLAIQRIPPPRTGLHLSDLVHAEGVYYSGDTP
ncbi:hypothetical protein AB0K74_21965 [Streptomyces sp. NPDC056159]|uniref:hypothetical protein n=1 Tax=Streptomyces sp. NPDC056159 TaxID=3155537 RepID=UPI003411FD84